MRHKFILLTAVCCLCLAGCRDATASSKVVQITYTADTGTILPEMQWHEEITITRDKLVLKRNGKTPDTQVNAGVWQFPANSQQVDVLFEQLEQISCSSVVRIEPEESPDGAGSESYTLTYANGKTCALVYDPGVSYTNDEWITIPVQALIQTFALPANAASRYLP